MWDTNYTGQTQVLPLQLRTVVMYGKSTETTYWAGLPVAVGEIEPVPVVLGQGTLEGTVTAESGGGISGARVSVDGLTATTSSQGQYTVSGVPEGDHTVVFSADGYNSKQVAVSIVSDKTSYANAVLVPVASGLGTLEGTVTAQGGGGIAGVVVSVGALTAKTSSQGRYAIAGVPEGNHTVSFSASGYYDKQIAVAISSDKTSYANAVLAPVPPPDTSAPVTNIHGVPTGWVNGNVVLSLLASDESGVASTYCSVGKDNWKRYTGPVTVSDEGETEFSYWSADNAGNYEIPTSVTVRIDKTAPSLDLHVAGDGTTSANVSAMADDELSKMSYVRAKVDSGDWADATSVNVTGCGTHTVTFVAGDAAGNETQKSVDVVVKCTTTESVLTKSVLVKYGSRVVLSGNLSNSAGLSLQGQSVGLSRFARGTWVPVVGASSVVGAYGDFSIVMRPADNGLYRFVYPGGTLSLPSVSDPMIVSVSARVSMPKAAVHHRRLTMSGRIEPMHSGGVTIYYERKVRGHYKAYTSRYVTMSSRGAYSKTLSLPAGTWRVRVKHEDPTHIRTYSSWRYVTIR